MERTRVCRRPPEIASSDARLIPRLRKYCHRLWLPMIGCVWLSLYSREGHADGFGGDAGFASDDVLRGLTESDHQLSPQLDLHYGIAGWYAGVTAVGVRRGIDRSFGAGLTAYAGYQRQFAQDWSASVSLRHYDYPGYQQRADYDYDEVALSLGWRERLLATVTASADVYAFDYMGHNGRGAAYSYELSGRQPLPWGLALNAGAGYYDLNQQIGAGYLYWSAGVATQWRAFNLDLRYVGTNDTAKQRFQQFAENRLVFSALWLF
jgi:uncharacterized protein (TIGR02001 family)